MEANVFVIIAIGLAALFGLWVVFYFIPVGLWFTALLSGVQIQLVDLVFMRYRKVPPQIIVHGMISCAKGGVIVDKDQLEAQYLAGDNVKNVTNGLIYAKAAGIPLTFKEASKMDLARKDIIKELKK